MIVLCEVSEETFILHEKTFRAPKNAATRVVVKGKIVLDLSFLIVNKEQQHVKTEMFVIKDGFHLSR